MPLSVADRLGSYEILAPLGAGGMGEVYRANDTKLDREVAIKVLPVALAQDAERLARFEREAKVLASLNHPNIAQIYGVEDSNGVRALVMELVPGAPLNGPFTQETALNCAKQIASALEAAHDKGIIHRDLKPANIMVTPEGVVKVLDFGLAAIPSRDVDGSNPANSPTMTIAATQGGMILGTAAYMSPEQAAGTPVDKRADIWSYGVVLWEMLSGQRLFGGETISHTLADVLRAPIDFDQLPKETPRAIRHLLQRCLDRDVKTRLRDIGEARIAIQNLGKEPDVAATVPAPSSRFGWVAWGVAGLFLLTTLALSLVHFREAPPPQRIARFQVELPDKTAIPIFELSPDGRTLAFTASDAGRRRLYLRPIDSLTAQAVPGTEDATYLFWSPDSAFIGYFVPGKLKKVALTGGPPQTVCEAADGRGGTWSSDGVIVLSPGPGAPLMRVAAAGGTPAPLMLSGVDGLHRYPAFLPDGKRFLFEVSNGKSGSNGIYVGSLDGSSAVKVLPDESSAAYATGDSSGKSGLLLFRREGTLMAVPFNPGAARSTGDAFPVAEQVGAAGNTNHAAFSVAENGILAYMGGTLESEVRELGWVDRTGKRTPLGQAGAIVVAALSPDGTRVVYSKRTEQTSDNADLWMLDVARGVSSRFTFRPGISSDPVWSPDGSRIIFQANNNSIYEKPVNGAGQEKLLIGGGINSRPQDWSPDGSMLVYEDFGRTTGQDLWLLPLEGDRKPRPYLQTPFNERDAQFSPDGRWMAYASNESGPMQVYVQSIPAGGNKFQISSAGGGQPRWRRDGKELFYISTDNKLMAVEVKISNTFEAGPPQPLFEMPLNSNLRWNYQSAADGQRFLVLSNSRSASPPLTVVLNWQAGIKH
jgi:eukaryotic-like serine/threonine-protein kinase